MLVASAERSDFSVLSRSQHFDPTLTSIHIHTHTSLNKAVRGAAQDNGPAIRPDAHVTSDGSSLYFDTSIIHPAAPSHLEKAQEGLGAALAREKYSLMMKWNVYCESAI